MIGTISVKVAAHNPSFPLEPVYVFVNSAQSFRIMNVPKKIGKWDIMGVFVNVYYPDNTVVAKECVLNGSVWVGTVSGCATSGTSTNGFVVTASGIDEDGNTVTNYVLGAGDLYVQALDGTIAPETSAAKMYFFATTPTSPKVGDATFIDGTMNIWNGTAWQPVATSTTPEYIEDADGNKIEADLSVRKLTPHKTWYVSDTRPGGDAYSLRPHDSFLSAEFFPDDPVDGTHGFNIELNQTGENDYAGLLTDYLYLQDEWVENESFEVELLNGATSATLGQYFIEYAPAAPSIKNTTLATLDDLPTKTSDLTNDSGYITASQVPTPSYIQDSAGNKIEADLSCVENHHDQWQLDAATLGTKILPQTSTDHWELIEDDKKYVITIDGTEVWTITYYQRESEGAIWYIIASGTDQSAPRDTNSLTVEMTGDFSRTWTATRPVTYQRKIATEYWVEGKGYITASQIPTPSYIQDSAGNKIEADRTFTWREKSSWYVSELNNGYYTYDPPLECAWGTYTIDDGLSPTQKQMWISKSPCADNEYLGIGANLNYVEYYSKSGDTYTVITGDTISEHTDNSITMIGLETCSITRTGEWSDLTATLATEEWVGGIVGNINSILDTINGEVI